MFLKSFVAVLVAVCVYFLIKNWMLPSKQTPMPLLIWWTKFMPKLLRDIDCSGGFSCQVTGDRHFENLDNLQAYLFYGSHLKNHDWPLPRNHSISWALYHEESPKNYALILYRTTQELFNFAATFSRHSDYPLTLQYLKSLKNFTVEEKNSYLGELAPVIYVQSDCDTPSDRDNLVRELMQYIKVDSYGKCLNNKEFPEEFGNVESLDYYNTALMNLISKYKFVISFENAICQDYITEKLWRPLFVGSVPIYLGSPTVEDWLPNKNSAILVKDFDDMKKLADFIKNINKNDTLYNLFLRHKLEEKISNKQLEKDLVENFNTGHTVTDFECFICKKLHKQRGGVIFEKLKKSIYHCSKPKNWKWESYWNHGKYQAKALNVFIQKNQPFSKEEFDVVWKRLIKNT